MICLLELAVVEGCLLLRFGELRWMNMDILRRRFDVPLASRFGRVLVFVGGSSII